MLGSPGVSAGGTEPGVGHEGFGRSVGPKRHDVGAQGMEDVVVRPVRGRPRRGVVVLVLVVVARLGGSVPGVAIAAVRSGDAARLAPGPNLEVHEPRRLEDQEEQQETEQPKQRL